MYFLGFIWQAAFGIEKYTKEVSSYSIKNHSQLFLFLPILILWEIKEIKCYFTERSNNESSSLCFAHNHLLFCHYFRTQWWLSLYSSYKLLLGSQLSSSAGRVKPFYRVIETPICMFPTEVSVLHGVWSIRFQYNFWSPGPVLRGRVSNKHFILKINRVGPEDVGIYYCMQGL